MQQQGLRKTADKGCGVILNRNGVFWEGTLMTAAQAHRSSHAANLINQRFLSWPAAMNIITTYSRLQDCYCLRCVPYGMWCISKHRIEKFLTAGAGSHVIPIHLLCSHHILFGGSTIGGFRLRTLFAPRWQDQSQSSLLLGTCHRYCWGSIMSQISLWNKEVPSDQMTYSLSWSHRSRASGSSAWSRDWSCVGWEDNSKINLVCFCVLVSTKVPSFIFVIIKHQARLAATLFV